MNTTNGSKTKKPGAMGSEEIAAYLQRVEQDIV
jgi:hypothetical protein